MPHSYHIARGGGSSTGFPPPCGLKDCASKLYEDGENLLGETSERKRDSERGGLALHPASEVDPYSGLK